MADTWLAGHLYKYSLLEIIKMGILKRGGVLSRKDTVGSERVKG